MEPVEKFGSIAKGLSRNPLGIIALFIVLIYGMAALVLGVCLSELMPYERIPMILFLIIFPFVVLAVFNRLVREHHWKLYSPSDYESDQSFLEPLSAAEQRERFAREMAELTQSAVAGNSTNQTTGNLKAEPIGEKIWLAESMAMREISNEMHQDLRREVDLVAGNGRVHLDGAAIKDKNLTGIEIKFDQLGNFKPESIEGFLNEFSNVAEKLKSKKQLNEYRLRLALVTENNSISDKNIAQSLESMANRYQVPVDVSVYNLKDLREKYGVIETKAKKISDTGST